MAGIVVVQLSFPHVSIIAVKVVVGTVPVSDRMQNMLLAKVDFLHTFF